MVLPSLLESIVERLAASPDDEAEWAALHRQLWPFVLATTSRRLWRAHDLAEDAAQEVFVRVARTRPFARLHQHHAIVGYFWRVADNTARDFLIHVLPRQTFITPTGLTRRPHDACATTVNGEHRLELREWLEGARQTLRPPDREILALVIDGYSLAEIAVVTRLSYANAGTRVHRLRKRLREYLRTRPLPDGDNRLSQRSASSA